MTSLAALLLACALLASCSTASMSRDLDVTGSLPRAIGLGAFSPSCLLFCFPSTTITQGDVIREDVDPESIRVHRTEVDQVKGQSKGIKVKPKPKAPPKAKE